MEPLIFVVPSFPEVAHIVGFVVGAASKTTPALLPFLDTFVWAYILTKKR